MFKFFLSVGWILASSAWAEEARIHLYSQVRVATDRYILSQVSSCHGNDAICQVLRSLDMGPSPQPGTVKNLRENEIRQILEEEGYEMNAAADSKSTILIVGSGVNVERLSFAIDSEQIRENVEEQVRSLLPNSGGQRWLVSLGLNSRQVQLSSEDWTAKVIGIEQFQRELSRTRSPFVRRIQIRVSTVSGETAGVQIWGTLRFTPEFKLLTFVNGLEKGAVITETDITDSWVGFAQYMDGAPRDASTVIGKRMKVAARPHSIVRFGVMEELPLVNRGEEVQIKLLSGAIEMESRGRTFQSGTLGQSVDVELEGSKKKVRSKVVAQGKVEVSL